MIALVFEQCNKIDLRRLSFLKLSSFFPHEFVGLRQLSWDPTDSTVKLNVLALQRNPKQTTPVQLPTFVELILLFATRGPT